MDGSRQTAPHRSPMARWLAVMEAFSRQAEWGIRDLAAATGLPRSVAHRIVLEMDELGLLKPAAVPGRREVGPTLLRLGLSISDGTDILRAARPILEELRDETGETAILTLYDPRRRQFRAVSAAESAHPIRYIWASLGDWSDVHRGASGKGILAFLPEAERDGILDDLEAPRPAGGAGVDRERLLGQLEQAARVGWVISHGERFAGAVGVSAPVRDAAGRVVGDVLLGWPDNRTDRRKETEAALAAKRAADRLSRAVGYEPRPGSPSPAGAG